jgi:hypothetical protein
VDRRWPVVRADSTLCLDQKRDKTPRETGLEKWLNIGRCLLRKWAKRERILNRLYPKVVHLYVVGGLFFKELVQSVGGDIVSCVNSHLIRKVSTVTPLGLGTVCLHFSKISSERKGRHCKLCKQCDPKRIEYAQ